MQFCADNSKGMPCVLGGFDPSSTVVLIQGYSPVGGIAITKMGVHFYL